MENPKRAPISVLSIEKKIEILRHLEGGVSVPRIANEYNIHPSTVRKIRRRGMPAYQGVDVRTRKRIRKPRYEDLDIKLYLWFVQSKTLGIPITDLLLQEKALQISQELGNSSSFKASHGWLWKFKTRHNIRLLDNEKDCADGPAAENFTKEFHKKIERDELQWEHIYNMSETGLIWKAIPAKSLLHCVEQKLEGKKLRKDRVIVCLCTNATGTHKLKPVIINKFRNPRALKYYRHQMPVVYKSQQFGSSMDHRTFIDWYVNDFKPAVQRYQLEHGIHERVVLILDDCWRNKLVSTERRVDDQFQIVFLPPQTTTLLQPMNQGLITKVKKTFRHKMLCRLIASSGLKEFYSKYTLRDCIQLLHETWTELNPKIIRNCWNNITKFSEEIIMKEEPVEHDEHLEETDHTYSDSKQYVHNMISAIREPDINTSDDDEAQVEEGGEVYVEEREGEEQQLGKETEHEIEVEDEINGLEANIYRQNDIQFEITEAFEILKRHAVGRPQYLRTLLQALKQALIREGILKSTKYM
nr:jerky protein homolog-like [Megalopta genalis]XP_033340640.1 jerky protein homolog-like [Megalopta genalis]